MQRSSTAIVIHPLDPADAAVIREIRTSAQIGKGMLRSTTARAAFDLMMEGVEPHDGVTFEPARVGGVHGLWVHPPARRPGAAILHLHSGWFSFGSATAFRHLVGHIAARAGASAFIPEYRLAPEHPFPAAVDDMMAAYRGLAETGFRRIAATGDSAGGNLALVLAAQVPTLAGVAVMSPVTDLTLAGASYETRAKVEPFFTREQVEFLVRRYLGGADPRHPLASPLHGPFADMPPIRIHVGDDEVLLDDARRYVERALAAGADARLDIWLGMVHGFAGSVGTLKASELALDDIGAFLAQALAGD
jgi:acetyl esterase/lipase